MVIFNLGSLLQGQMRTERDKSTYNSLIIGPRGFECETNLQKTMGWESTDVVRFGLGSLIQGETVVDTGIGELSFRWIQT